MHLSDLRRFSMLRAQVLGLAMVLVLVLVLALVLVLTLVPVLLTVMVAALMVREGKVEIQRIPPQVRAKS